MQLSIEDSRELLSKFGVYATEACDRCGRILGPVRFTRVGESGAWCSRNCRDGADAHAPGTCHECRGSLHGLRVGTRFCSDTCRQRSCRKSRIQGISSDAALETKTLESPKSVPSYSDPNLWDGTPELGKTPQVEMERLNKAFEERYGKPKTTWRSIAIRRKFWERLKRFSLRIVMGSVVAIAMATFRVEIDRAWHYYFDHGHDVRRPHR